MIRIKRIKRQKRTRKRKMAKINKRIMEHLAKTIYLTKPSQQLAIQNLVKEKTRDKKLKMELLKNETSLH